jgi:hypothetical protein
LKTTQSLADALKLVVPEGQDYRTVDTSLEFSVEEFCRCVLQSREYRQSVLDRVRNNALPSAVECKMYDYAYGKPVERVEHSTKDGKPLVTVIERQYVDVVDTQIVRREPDGQVH